MCTILLLVKSVWEDYFHKTKLLRRLLFIFAKRFHIYSLTDTPLISNIHMVTIIKINHHFNTSLRILIMFQDNQNFNYDSLVSAPNYKHGSKTQISWTYLIIHFLIYVVLHIVDICHSCCLVLMFLWQRYIAESASAF